MEPQKDRKYIAFADGKKIASGAIIAVASKAKKTLKANPKSQILIFDDLTSQQIEIDFRGTLETVQQRLEEVFAKNNIKPIVGPGRPRLGVIAKEVTLLPEHWDWLGRQPGGASVTLRKMIEEAKKKNQGKDLVRQRQEAVYKFMTVMAGDLKNYEEALRALYAGDPQKFAQLISDWPKDIQKHTTTLAQGAWPTV